MLDNGEGGTATAVATAATVSKSNRIEYEICQNLKRIYLVWHVAVVFVARDHFGLCRAATVYAIQNNKLSVQHFSCCCLFICLTACLLFTICI